MTEDTNIKVVISDRDIIKVKIQGISCAEGTIDSQALRNWIKMEEPIKLTAKKFRTTYNYISGLLKVYYNGIKTTEIVEVSSNEFELPIDSLSEDTVEVEYYRQI